MKFTLLHKIFQFIIVFLLIVLVWEILVRVSGESSLLPLPETTFVAFADVVKEGELLSDIVASLRRIIVGFTIAALSAMMINAVLASVPRLSTILLPVIELFRPIPPIAWIPIAVLWLGIGDKPAYFIVFLGAFFPIFTNTFLGINSTDEIYLRAAKTLGANRLMTLRTVVLPSALPSIITGLRIGLGTAWICVITAELVGAQSGLGYMIQLNRIMLQTDRVLVGMIVIGLIGFLMNRCALWVSGILMPWYQGTRAGE